MNRLATIAAGAVIATSAMSATQETAYIHVGDDAQFHIGNSEIPYRFTGTNFWYGPILASDGPWGDSERLNRELDSLQAMGIDNLRILAGAEGPDSIHHHIAPQLQTAPGVYNNALLTGLDRFIAELERRGMYAVIYLTNAWEWSGGYGSYLQWTGHGQAPDPNDDGYQEYVNHVAQFVLDDSARQMAVDHARFMAGRINSVTGRPYAESPAIMAWQVCNEPRAFSKAGKEALLSWITDMARAIKSQDPNHMVSTGSEGKYGCEIDIDLWQRIHALPEIDYAIIHLWPTNWGWASRDSVEEHVGYACESSDEYIAEHLDSIASLGKPLVIEEFGYPRNGFKFTTDIPVTARDIYYRHILDRAYGDKRIAGVNFWGWNGSGRAATQQWQPGNAFLCDPAHEPQGMYGVFDTDLTTIEIIRESARKMASGQ